MTDIAYSNTRTREASTLGPPPPPFPRLEDPGGGIGLGAGMPRTPRFGGVNPLDATGNSFGCCCSAPPGTRLPEGTGNPEGTGDPEDIGDPEGIGPPGPAGFPPEASSSPNLDVKGEASPPDLDANWEGI